MKDYWDYLPAYVLSCFHWVDFILGGLLLVFYLWGAEQLGLSIDQKKTATVVLVILVIAHAGYFAYLPERIMRAQRESEVLFTAQVGSFSANVPDPGPTRFSFKVHIWWEISTGHDVSTDALALNVYYRNRKRWWKLWQTKEKGIPIGVKGAGIEYRKSLRAIETQPFKDNGQFEFEGDRKLQVTRTELALRTLVPPHRRFVIPLNFLSFNVFWGELHGRGTPQPP